MKLQFLLTITLALLCSIVASLNIPYNDMDDFEIAKMYVAELNSAPVTDNSQGCKLYHNCFNVKHNLN